MKNLNVLKTYRALGWLWLGMSVFFLLSACQRKGKTGDELFETLDSTQTGLSFVNEVIDDDTLNIVDYLYYYNGGGVAAGDVNNDGLTDLYFVSNRGTNRLYLNQGNFKFRDVTAQAGVGGYADWQTGVTMADVNGDGWLDLYVCAVGNYKKLEGSNELYINNQDGTFTERAADYGLDFTGFSTQAAFFDYDHDGDLDCYLLNHAVHNAVTYGKVTSRFLRDNEAGDRLYENLGSQERGVRSENLESQNSRSSLLAPGFKDVSEEAGIYGAPMGYGLGISVGDLDNDGWEDLYVSNDFHEDDYYYHNNGDGTFTEKLREAFGHTSRFSMGNDIVDLNNDGWSDVLTLDMFPDDERVEKASAGEDGFEIYHFKLSYGYFYQFARNCLQLNLGGNRFVDVAAQMGLAATDWSWSPLGADFDNDGVKDLFISNGIARRPNDLDYVKYVYQDSIYAPLNERQRQAVQAAIRQMPEGKVRNYLFQGKLNGPFELGYQDRTEAWGLTEPSLSNGAIYADLDNDGDLDLVTNDLNAPAGVYRNRASERTNNHFLKLKFAGTGANRFGVGATVFLRTGGTLQQQQNVPTRGFESSVEPNLTFGLGTAARVDSLLVRWPGGAVQVLRNVPTDTTLTLRQADAQPQPVPVWWSQPVGPAFEAVAAPAYRHRENRDYFDFYREPLMPFLLSTEGPKLAQGDVNGDGRVDLFVPGAKFQPGQLLLQTPEGTFVPSRQPAFDPDSSAEDVASLLFDADRDGDLDLYVATGGNEYTGPELQDRLYRNDGRGTFTKDPAALPRMLDTKSCVKAADFDRDGDLDLFIGGRVRANAYGQSPNSYLLVNDGRGRFTDQTDRLAPGLRQAGMVTDAVWADADGDRVTDLLVVGDWMAPKFFRNAGGKLAAQTPTFAAESGGETVPMNGFWQAAAAADFDRDGDVDFILGNLGLNTKLRRRGSSHLKLWIKDFDGNGQAEHLLAYEAPPADEADGYFPLATKDELAKQMPSLINKRFTRYADFAGKPIGELFEKKEFDGATELDVTQFASVWLENRGTGGFVVHPLPGPMQWSKLFALTVIDLDGNGTPDVLSGGNFDGVTPYQGRYDASPGVTLLNDGKGKFRAVPGPLNGLAYRGEVRDVQVVPTGTGPRYVVSRNNDSLLIFRKK